MAPPSGSRSGALKTTSGVFSDTATTDDLAEGSTQYFTTARARSSVSATAPVAYSSSTGVVSMAASTNSVDGYLTAADHTAFAAKLSQVAYSSTTTSRTLNSNFTPNASSAVMACYTVSIACSISLGGSCSGTVDLRSDTNTTPTTSRGQASMSLGGTLVLGLTLSNTQVQQLCYLVPPTHNVRLVTSGTATITLVTQVETAINPS